MNEQIHEEILAEAKLAAEEQQKKKTAKRKKDAEQENFQETEPVAKEEAVEIKPSGNKKDLKALFERLYNLDLSGAVEQKGQLSYLSWARAWAELCKNLGEDDEVSYRIIFNEDGMPYTYDPLTGYYVFTEVTINGDSRLMWLPVMDGNNRAMKAEPYDFHYTAYGKDKVIRVQAATATDINKAIMRCLVKNLAMFGLGLRVYNNEDLPEPDDGEKQNVGKQTSAPEKAPVTAAQRPATAQNAAAQKPAAQQPQTAPVRPVQAPAEKAKPAEDEKPAPNEPEKTAAEPSKPIDPNTRVKDLEHAQAYIDGMLNEMTAKGISVGMVTTRKTWNYCQGDLGNLRFEDFMKLKEVVSKSAPAKGGVG